MIINNDQVIIRDELQTLDDSASIKWTMVTDAQVDIDHSTVSLSKNGKKIFLDVLLPIGVKIQSYPARSDKAYDSSNGNAKIVSIEFTLKPREHTTFNILFHRNKKPHSTKNTDLPLNQWPITLPENTR